MKNIVVLVFIFLVSNTSFAQNSDKLTLKGGVMLGVPNTKAYKINYVNYRRGMCWECPPEHTGLMKLNTTVNLFSGVEYFPWKIKLSEKGIYLLPFTSLNFYLYSTNYDYEIEDIHNRKYEGQYVISSFFTSMSLGVKLSIDKYKLDILASTDVMSINYFFRERVLKHEFDTPNSFYNSNDNMVRRSAGSYIEFVSPFRFQLDFRYKLNNLIALHLGYTSSYLGAFNESNLVDVNRKAVPSLYHQISLGVTYQLLSHKNKTVEKTEQ